ncbi:MAG: PLDc N-terminal domain-containing protein [Ktedonobacterales bacterium]
MALVLIFIPLLGHVILTVMIIGDDLSGSEKLLWLLVVWLVPFLGPFLYLLLGQRRDRVFGARPV